MKPGYPLTDPRFKYVSAANTDIRKTFARVKREIAETERKSKHVTHIETRRRANKGE